MSDEALREKVGCLSVRRVIRADPDDTYLAVFDSAGRQILRPLGSSLSVILGENDDKLAILKFEAFVMIEDLDASILDPASAHQVDIYRIGAWRGGAPALFG